MTLWWIDSINDLIFLVGVSAVHPIPLVCKEIVVWSSMKRTWRASSYTPWPIARNPCFTFNVLTEIGGGDKIAASNNTDYLKSLVYACTRNCTPVFIALDSSLLLRFDFYNSFDGKWPPVLAEARDQTMHGQMGIINILKYLLLNSRTQILLWFSWLWLSEAYYFPGNWNCEKIVKTFE